MSDVTHITDKMPLAMKRPGQLALRAPGMQIIAYVCQLLPRAPAPDPELRWIEGEKGAALQQ